MGCVYAAINKKTKRVYVGKTVKSLRLRKCQHGRDAMRRVTRFGAAIKKYGIDGFWWFPIFESDDPLALVIVECFYIDIWKANTKIHGYNLTSGGDGMTGHSQSQETRCKRSLTMKGLGLKRSPETREKIAATKRGKKRSPATIEKMRLASTGRKDTDETKRKKSINSRGHKLSPETRERQSVARRKSLSVNVERYGESRNGRAKLTINDIPFIRTLLRSGVTKRDIAIIFGVYPSTIALIERGRTWHYVPESTSAQSAVQR